MQEDDTPECMSCTADEEASKRDEVAMGSNRYGCDKKYLTHQDVVRHAGLRQPRVCLTSAMDIKITDFVSLKRREKGPTKGRNVGRCTSKQTKWWDASMWPVNQLMWKSLIVLK